MAEVTQWQVDRLCAQTGVPEPAARSALDQTGGDLLAAALLLEKVGQVRRTNGGSYTTAAGAAGSSHEAAGGSAPPPPRAGAGECKGKSSAAPTEWGARAKKVLDVLLHLQWEVWRGGKRTVAIPILLLLILLCVRPPLALIILGVCLFFGCRYRLAGAAFPGMDAINSFLDGAYALISDLVGDAKSKLELSDEDRNDKGGNR